MKIKFAFVRGLGIGGREENLENYPKTLFVVEMS